MSDTMGGKPTVTTNTFLHLFYKWVNDFISLNDFV